MINTEYVQSELNQQHDWTKTGPYSVTNELFLDLVFTDQCNCSCPFCIARTKEYAEEDFEAWKRSLVRALDIFDVKSIIILGGEATVDERFGEKLEYIHDAIKNKRIHNLILTTNGIMLRNKKILQTVIRSDINAVNLSYMHYDKEKNDRIFRNNTLSKEEIQDIYALLKQNDINMRMNVNVYQGNMDTVSEMGHFTAYFEGCCDALKFSPLMQTDMFDTVSEVTEYTQKVAMDSDRIKELFESFEQAHELLDKKDGILGFVRYSEVLAGNQKVMLKYAQVEDKYDPDTEIPTLKLYPNGNLSNTWDFRKNILAELIDTHYFQK